MSSLQSHHYAMLLVPLMIYNVHITGRKLFVSLTSTLIKKFVIYHYNPPGYSIGRHVFLSGILSGGTVYLLTLVTMNIVYINSRC